LGDILAPMPESRTTAFRWLRFVGQTGLNVTKSTPPVDP
jgi:hypothetical protein